MIKLIVQRGEKRKWKQKNESEFSSITTRLFQAMAKKWIHEVIHESIPNQSLSLPFVHCIHCITPFHHFPLFFLHFVVISLPLLMYPFLCHSLKKSCCNTDENSLSFFRFHFLFSPRCTTSLTIKFASIVYLIFLKPVGRWDRVPRLSLPFILLLYTK